MDTKIRKYHTVFVFAVSLIITFLFGITGCKDNVTNPPDNSNNGSIKTGDKVDVASQSITSGGGTVVVSASGKLIDGLTITIPANSFSDLRTFAISYAPVTSHSFGTYFKPVSPLITISNGGGYGDSIMLVKIPVTLAAGEIPIPFFYDDIKGKLEPVPVSAYDGSSVTIMTKHFDVSGIAASAAPRKGGQPQSALSDYAKIIVSGLTDKLYTELVGSTSQIITGYKPHVDDWEFVNHGSYLLHTRRGHCAGQNVSSLWYYFEKKSQTGKNLYHQFDQVNDAPDKIWEDNPLGYHMASAVQAKLDWDALSLRIYEDYVSMQDDYTWRALVVSMLITKEPYDIGIYGLYQGKIAGHDLTAYGVNIAAGKILIADPNYPGDLTREINYANGHFSPYFSGLTADQSDISFTSIKFTSKTAVIDWNVIGQTWTSVIDNKQNPGYPTYSLWVNDGAGYPLTDGFKTDLDTLDISLKWGNVGDIAFIIYDGSGNRLAPPPGANYGLVLRDTTVLKPGDNKLGIAVYGEDAGKFYYIDFQWITIIYQSSTLKIDPATMNGQKDSTYVWKSLFSSKPSNARYEWNFGDGSSKYIVTNDTNGYHTYYTAGNYKITLQVFNKNTNTKVAEATAAATIGAGFEITSVVPENVSYAMPVTINGSGFGITQGTSSVNIGDVAAESIISWSDTKIVAIVPESTVGTALVKVTVGGKVSNAKYLTRRAPKINSLSKTHAKPDELLEIRGEYFGYKPGGSMIYFRQIATTFTVVTWNDTVITLLVPDVDATVGWNYGKGSLYIEHTGWGMSYADFTLDEDLIKTLHRTNSWSALTFGGRQLMYLSYPTPHEEYQGFWMHIYNKDFKNTQQIAWTGTSFSFTFTETTGSSTYKITLNGTVADDGTTIKTIHGKYEYIYQDKINPQYHHYEYVFKNVPMSKSYPGEPSVEYRVTGPTVKDYITSAVYREERNGALEEEYRGTDWTNTESVPEILFRFEKK